MKKLIAGLVLVLLFGCSNKTTEDNVKRITWTQALTKRQVVLISKSESTPPPTFIPLRTVYIIKDEKVFFIDNIPHQVWNDYFKDAKKGDTITFY